jgi:hypothetical protein
MAMLSQFCQGFGDDPWDAQKLPRILYWIISKIDSCCAIGSYYGGRG